MVAAARIPVEVEWTSDDEPYAGAYAMDRAGREYLIDRAEDLGGGRWGLVLWPMERGERIPDGADVAVIDWGREDAWEGSGRSSGRGRRRRT